MAHGELARIKHFVKEGPSHVKRLLRCPFCGSRKIKLVTEDRKIRLRRGKTLVIPNVPREVCFSCGEEFFGPDAGQIEDAFLFGRRRQG